MMMTYTGKQYLQVGGSKRSIDRALLHVLLCCACGGIATTAQAETRAGDRVVNTATARYNIGADEEVATSNSDVILVAERLDIGLSRLDPVAATAIPLVLVNRGNGMEAFRFSTAVDGGVAPTRFAIDTDGDGRYDPARDTLLTDATTPLLAPGASLAVLLLLDGTKAASVTIAAQAVTGFGAPGTIFAGQGDGGGDAVVGPTGARAELVAPAAIQTPEPTLTKTQSVLAPDGTARAVRGATISYALVAHFPTALSAARIDDAVPAGTIYLRGSLSLDGVAVSDPGTPDAVSVSLGDVPADTTRTIQFKVRIQ